MYVSSTLRHALGLAASWACAALILVAGYLYLPEIRAFTGGLLGLPELQEQLAELERAAAVTDQTSGSTGAGTVELRAGQGGHYHTEARINGSRIEVMVDTGATTVALTWEDAQAAGIFIREADFTHRARTANGEAKVAPVTISQITIGDITVHNVRGSVMERNKLTTTLLGMSFLGRLSRAEMRKGTLILEQ